jgi:hypothetical protein
LQELLADEHGTHQRAEDDDAGQRRHPESAARRHMEVVEGVPRAALADHERDRGRDRDDPEPDRHRSLVRDRSKVDRDDEGSHHDRCHDAAEVVDRVARLVHMARHEHDRQHERESGERQRDEEHRSPPEVLEHAPGDQRAKSRQPASDR